MPDHKNLILAVVLSLVIIVGFEFLWQRPEPQPVTDRPTATRSLDPDLPAPRPGAVPGDGVTADGLPQAPGTMPTRPTGPMSREQALAATPRVPLDTPRLTGSINLVGARFDDLTLRDYRVAPDAAAENIVLLAPRGAPEPYFGEYGWVPAEQGLAVPGIDTRWQSDGATLTPDQPLTLSWTSPQGLTFTRRIEVDQNYMFTIHETVTNDGNQTVTLFPYGRVQRGYRPPTIDFYILHEGPLGVFNDTLKELDYGDVEDEGRIEQASVGGWIGITDKYWLTALDFPRETETMARFSHRREGERPRYQVDFLGAAQTVAPGASTSISHDFFAGAKEVKLLDAYAEERNISRFDLAIDFGWFYFLTKPFFYVLLWLNSVIGNAGLAIIAFTFILRLLMYPLANKSYKSMSKMKALQPDMKALQERFKDDRQRLNQEMMALYKEKGVNPVSGCLPIVVQIPIFFALYKVLYVSIEMRHAPFFGWIQDLSAPDPTSMFNLFGLIPWDPPSFLMIGVWPLIMGLTMWLQQRLNPAPTDPMQAKILMWLPVIFTVLLAGFPAGLVIYWATNNILSMSQQWYIMRKMGVKA